MTANHKEQTCQVNDFSVFLSLRRCKESWVTEIFPEVCVWTSRGPVYPKRRMLLVSLHPEFPSGALWLGDCRGWRLDPCRTGTTGNIFFLTALNLVDVCCILASLWSYVQQSHDQGEQVEWGPIPGVAHWFTEVKTLKDKFKTDFTEKWSDEEKCINHLEAIFSATPEISRYTNHRLPRKVSLLPSSVPAGVIIPNSGFFQWLKKINKGFSSG